MNAKLEYYSGDILTNSDETKGEWGEDGVFTYIDGSQWRLEGGCPASGTGVYYLERAKGFNTPIKKQQVYVPGEVWCKGFNSGPNVSVEEALDLGAIPGTIDLEKGTAKWPQHFFNK